MVAKYPIHTVKNAMQIVRLFTNEKPEWTQTELSKASSLNISQTQRLLHTLTTHGYLEKNESTKKYRLGLSIIRLSGVLTTTMDIYKEARFALLKLFEKYELDFHIGVLEGIHVVYLDKFETLYSTRFTSYIGKRNPAYCTGCGKVLLAYKEKSIQGELVNKINDDGFEKFGPNTILTVVELKNELHAVYRNGYAISAEELIEGFTSIAVPVFDYSEKVIAAISLTGSDKDVNSPEIIKELLLAGKVISSKLGYFKTIGGL